MLLVEETEEAERAKGVRWVPPFSNSPPAPRMRVCNTLPYPMTKYRMCYMLKSLSFCVDFWAWCLLCLGYLRILYAGSFVPGVCLSCCGPLGWGWWVTYSADCYSEQSFFILSFHPVLLLYIIRLSAAWWLVIWVLVTDSVQFPTSGSPTHNSFCSIQQQ